MKKMFNEGNQTLNFMSSSGSGTVINYGSGSGSDFLTSYGSGYGSGSTSQKVTVPTVPVPVPQHWSSVDYTAVYRQHLCVNEGSRPQQHTWNSKAWFFPAQIYCCTIVYIFNIFCGLKVKSFKTTTVSREPRKRRPTRCRQARRVDSAGPVSPTCF